MHEKYVKEDSVSVASRTRIVLFHCNEIPLLNDNSKKSRRLPTQYLQQGHFSYFLVLFRFGVLFSSLAMNLISFFSICNS